MRREIELHDSKVIALSWRETTLILELNAYVHESDGVPGVDAGTGWSQVVEVAVANAALEQVCPLPLWITDGSIRVGSRNMDGVPLPFDSSERVSAALSGAEGTLRVTGHGLKVSAMGQPIFVELVPGT